MGKSTLINALVPGAAANRDLAGPLAGAHLEERRLGVVRNGHFRFDDPRDLHIANLPFERGHRCFSCA